MVLAKVKKTENPMSALDLTESSPQPSDASTRRHYPQHTKPRN